MHKDDFTIFKVKQFTPEEFILSHSLLMLLTPQKRAEKTLALTLLPLVASKNPDSLGRNDWYLREAVNSGLIHEFAAILKSPG